MNATNDSGPLPDQPACGDGGCALPSFSHSGESSPIKAKSRFRTVCEGVAACSLIGGSFFWLLLKTWGTWCDPLADFGQRLYFAWRVSAGDVLYRDLAYYNGPLSTYGNGLVFRLFGTGLNVLIGFNLFLLCLLLATIYWLFQRIGSRSGAVIACLMFLWLFAFARFTGVGNYNYVCPYSHAVIHGLILSLWGIAALWMLGRFGAAAAATSGFFFGLSVLTKAEMSLAGLGAATVAWVSLLLVEPSLRKRAATLLATFVAALAVPPLAAVAGLAIWIPWKEATAGALGTWVVMFRPDMRALKFFQDVLGTTDLAGNVERLSVATACHLIVLTAIVLFVAKSRRLPPAARLAIAVGGSGLMCALIWMRPLRWLEATCALPVLMILLATEIILEYRPTESTPRKRLMLLERLSLTVFAALLLAKMSLDARIWHYGFVLGMPAFLLLVAALWDFLPQALFRDRRDGWVYRAAIVPFLVSWPAVAWYVQQSHLTEHRFQIGSGGDTFYDSTPQGEAVQGALRWIHESISPEEGILAIPRGAMLNYLMRCRCPVPFTSYMPPEATFFGQDRIFAAVQQASPQWLIIAPTDFSEFGVSFGDDYFGPLARWIESNYEVACQVSDGGNRYHILICTKRRATKAQTSGSRAARERSPVHGSYPHASERCQHTCRKGALELNQVLTIDAPRCE
jgi:hypothetical protein